MSTWNDRLRTAMKEKDVTASDLVRATGISAAGIKKWVDGVTSQPKYEDVIQACKALQITPEWLMSGETSAMPVCKLDENVIVLDRVDIKASCGIGVANWEDVPCIKQMQVSRAWFDANFPYHKAENIKVITAIGDSMEPIVKDQDTVFIDIADKDYIRDGIYAALVDGDLYIKRIQKLPGNSLRFISQNPIYPPFEVSSSSDVEVLIIGRMIKALKVVSV